MALASSGNVNLTASGSANTKGSYTQLFASTSWASSRLYLTIHSGGTLQNFYVDIAVGAAASEVVKVSNVHAWCNNEALDGSCHTIDVDIPAGSRVAARCQCSTGGGVVGVSVHLEERALTGNADPQTYGPTGSTRGTSVTSDASASVKGSYAQLTASTTALIDELLVIVHRVSTGLTAYEFWQIDIATGAAASETIVIPDILVSCNTLSDSNGRRAFRFPVSIPASTRIAARASCSVAVAKVMDVTVIGVQTPGHGAAAVPVAVAYGG